jgi:hypothetical protein
MNEIETQNPHSLDALLIEAREHLEKVNPPGVSLVDELLKERRAEAAREEQEFQELSRTEHAAKTTPTAG